MTKSGSGTHSVCLLASLITEHTLHRSDTCVANQLSFRGFRLVKEEDQEYPAAQAQAFAEWFASG
jgi:hypothetical protein